MWACPKCNQKFIKVNQSHSCMERTVDDFLYGKSPYTVALFHYFIEQFKSIGKFELHPAKSRIAFAAKVRFGYIHRIGRDYIDVALTFPKPHRENLCFYRIGEVPGGKYFQHYLRLYKEEDLNDEVKEYLRLALEYGNKSDI